MKAKWITSAFTMLLVLLPGSKAFALDLIRDGKAVSTIVIPDEASDLEQKGAETLVKYLEMGSGVKLSVVKESEKPAGTVISLGKTRIAKHSRVSDENLEYDGYHLLIKEGTLYLLGRDGKIVIDHNGCRFGAQGSIRAALGLLEQIGFRGLQPGPMGVYIPELKTVSVPDDLNFTHTPIFMYVHGSMHHWGDWSLANSYRDAVPIYSGGGHTWDKAVPPSLWKEHPEYFRMQGGKRIQPAGSHRQLCPSNPDVIRLITEYTIKKFAEGFNIVALGQPDGWQSCECEACRALGGPGEEYEQVHLTQKKIIETAGKKYPDKYVHLLIYGPTSKPSSRFKKYPDNTMAEVCNDDEKTLDFWKSIIPGGLTVYVYYMGTYQSVGIAPKLTARSASERIRLLHKHNVKGIYYCGGGENWGAEGPAYYVLGRMATDPTQDWHALLGEYCNLTFGKAGKTMLQYYDLLYERLDIGGRQSGADNFTAVYTPEALERLANFLALARKQAVGDERALGWIRLAEISYNHFALIAKTYHFYQSYMLNPTMENLKQVRDAVKAYHAFIDELTAMREKDAAFVKNYFPTYGLWTTTKSNRGPMRTNFNKLSSPFTWNFDALIKAGILPGKTRSEAVFTKLSTAPVIDGDPSEDAWKEVPWTEVREVSLGEAEAATRLRLGHDEKNIYIAFECGEPCFEEMKVIEYDRDGAVYNTECVEIFLAPDGVGQKRVQLVISPTPDGKWDGRYGYIDDPLHPLVLSDSPDTTWNPAYSHAFKLDKTGKKWTIEIAFPFSELGMDVPAEGTRWCGNFGRERHKRVWDPKKYTGQRELFLWSPNLQQASFTDPTAFGDVYFGSIPDKQAK